MNTSRVMLGALLGAALAISACGMIGDKASPEAETGTPAQQQDQLRDCDQDRKMDQDQDQDQDRDRDRDCAQQGGS